MPARLRKLVGSVGVVAFLLGYIAVVSALADRVPDQIVWRTLFFTAAGVLWGVPLIPLIRWMNTEPEGARRPEGGPGA